MRIQRLNRRIWGTAKRTRRAKGGGWKISLGVEIFYLQIKVDSREAYRYASPLYL